MSTIQNLPPSLLGIRERENDLQLGPRKKRRMPNPLVHHGRHFGRTIHALCNVKQLLSNGVLRLNDAEDMPKDGVLAAEKGSVVFSTHSFKWSLVLNSASWKAQMTVKLIAGQKGASSARFDDTKTLKSAVLNWITPRGQQLNPPLARNIKTDRGFHHERTGALLCPAGLDWSNEEIRANLRSGDLAVPGDQWPIFIYHGYTYDAEDPWNGAFQSSLLVSAYKHIFTSPSSVDKEPKATRSGNARIHGMIRVTPASIAYIATQVRFSLTSSPAFSKVTDSEKFYDSIIELFDDPDEEKEVDELLKWWNRQIFPSHSSTHPSSKNSVLVRIKEKRAAMKAMQENTGHATVSSS